MQGNIGFDICTDAHFRKDAWLFGEAQGRVVVSVKPAQKEQLMNHFKQQGIDCLHIGTVKGQNMHVDAVDFGSINSIADIYNNAIAKKLA